MYVFLTKILLYVRIKLGVTHAFEMFTCEFCFHSSPLQPMLEMRTASLLQLQLPPGGTHPHTM